MPLVLKGWGMCSDGLAAAGAKKESHAHPTARAYRVRATTYARAHRRTHSHTGRALGTCGGHGRESDRRIRVGGAVQDKERRKGKTSVNMEHGKIEARSEEHAGACGARKHAEKKC